MEVGQDAKYYVTGIRLTIFITTSVGNKVE